MRILFLNIVVNCFGFKGSPGNGGIVNQCVYCAEFLSVKGFTALLEIASGFHDVSFLQVVYHNHSVFAFLFFFLSP